MWLVFEKYQGTGNDFLMVDDWDQTFPTDKSLIEALCTRKMGIGADGLILLQPEEETDFRMTYFNADGKMSSMCGNGGRCIADFAYQKGYASAQQNFKAIDGYHQAAIKANTVALTMQPVNDIRKNAEFYHLDTGSPHLVYFLEDTQNLDVKNKGRHVRNNDQFREQGINVNFVSIEDANAIRVRTYERGVEDETLSCGTGVVASAIAYHLFAEKPYGLGTIDVNTLGGPLKVHLECENYDRFQGIWLEGPIANVFQGSVDLNDFQT